MNNKIALIAVFLVFLIPVVTATLMHSQWFDWQPGAMRNHGELLQPVVPLLDFEVLSADGQTRSRQDLLDRWMLVFFAESSCDEACLESLYWMRQVRRAQDRHQNDVGLVFAAAEAPDEDTIAQILALAQDYIILTGFDQQAFWSQLPRGDVNAAYFILDPRANIILRYPSDVDHNGIRRDLRRLLTWTQRE
ncbi:MAG: SCO family protein [Wenzhouxiangella sp.]